MIIVHVDETFHPAYGYQLALLAKFQQRNGDQITIVTVDKMHLHPVYRDFGDDGSSIDQDDVSYRKTTGVKILRVKTYGYFMHRAVISKKIFDIVREQKPDVVFVHCVESLTAMRFLLHRKEWPLIFDSHMLSMASKSRFVGCFEAFYRATFRKIIEKNHCYVVRNQDDDYVNNHLGIKRDLTPFVSFGTDTIMFYPSEEVRESFRHQNGIAQNEFVVLYTGKLTEAKGGLFLAKALKNKFTVPITFVCVGSPPDNEYGRMVQKALNESENRVIMFPTQKYRNLAAFYQMADLSIFPKQCSLSFYDAQACGLPVLSEKNNVNRERCSHNNGANFEPGSIDDFRKLILKYATMKKNELYDQRSCARKFIELEYDYSVITKKYSSYLQKTVSTYNRNK